MSSATAEAETRERLLRQVKKEVKQIMEEAVTRKFVHEESSSITSLCGAVEACLQHGLKKRALGLFKNSTTNALLQKLSKNFEPAGQIVKLLQEIENNNDPKTGWRSIDGNKPQKRPLPAYNPKYMWIRLALFEKQLGKIIDHLVNHSSKFYEKEALLADPVDGHILASLLVGPCALDYTKMKTSDHYWTDPPADELVQRHRIHSSAPTHHIVRPDSPKRPGLQVRRNTSSSSEESMRTAPMSAKEYVESLHQNSKSTLLYGKNNVMVQPKEDVEKLAGYLSLHQSLEGLIVKWTPNQLMNGCCEQKEEDVDRSLYWDYAVTIYLDEIVYLHCHQQPDSGGTIVLVGQDGVQRPPIHFPRGGHLLAFLSCMENGLLPHGQLDPPLWTQRGKGKVFPKLRRKGSRLTSSMSSQKSEDLPEDSAVSVLGDEDEATDYVFRIITTFKPESIPETMMDPKVKPEKAGILAAFPWPPKESHSRSQLTQAPAPPTPPTSSSSSSSPSSIQNYAKAQEQNNASCLSKSQQAGHRNAVKLLCDTMKKQIISRAFYGWIAHCRHLKTVRTHLSGLVNQTIVSVNEKVDASGGLTEELWHSMIKDGIVMSEAEIYRLVYYGGCAHEIRREVWPYLLGHYKFRSTPEERSTLDESLKETYEKTMSEWLAVEAIVRQRDKEIMAANLAKLSGESQDGHIPLMRKDSSLSNDVFESVDSDDFSHPETLPEESSSATTPTTPSTVLSGRSNETVVVARGVTVSTTSKDTTSTASPDEGLGDSLARACSLSESKRSDSCDTDKNLDMQMPPDAEPNEVKGIIVTNPSVDSGTEVESLQNTKQEPGKLGSMSEEGGLRGDLGDKEYEHYVDKISQDFLTLEKLSASRESLISPASPISVASNGGVYSAELLDNVALNLHRIDKDVQRCDRAYYYFTPENLDKLRNVMCTYVWEHLDVGYVQGMCDLVAPLLVIFDDEAKTYGCFCQLMKRMSSNFPHGGAMDTHFANMRSLIQILDSELFEHMHQNGDYTHFYFCYRWFLLDFKRELVYDDVFSVWETIWAAKHVSSSHFVLFIALALVEYYRDIILDNNMDFTDIIKFFNEMAERHNAKQVLKISRDLVYRLQDLIENK